METIKIIDQNGHTSADRALAAKYISSHEADFVFVPHEDMLSDETLKWQPSKLLSRGNIRFGQIFARKEAGIYVTITDVIAVIDITAIRDGNNRSSGSECKHLRTSIREDIIAWSRATGKEWTYDFIAIYTNTSNDILWISYMDIHDYEIRELNSELISSDENWVDSIIPVYYKICRPEIV